MGAFISICIQTILSVGLSQQVNLSCCRMFTFLPVQTERLNNTVYLGKNLMCWIKLNGNCITFEEKGIIWMEPSFNKTSPVLSRTLFFVTWMCEEQQVSAILPALITVHFHLNYFFPLKKKSSVASPSSLMLCLLSFLPMLYPWVSQAYQVCLLLTG